MTNPFSKLGELIQEDHKKIEEHTVESLRICLTIDQHHFGFDNKISNDDVEKILKMVGNTINAKCKAVYHNQI